MDEGAASSVGLERDRAVDPVAVQDGPDRVGFGGPRAVEVGGIEFDDGRLGPDTAADGGTAEDAAQVALDLVDDAQPLWRPRS